MFVVLAPTGHISDPEGLLAGQPSPAQSGRSESLSQNSDGRLSLFSALHTCMFIGASYTWTFEYSVVYILLYAFVYSFIYLMWMGVCAHVRQWSMCSQCLQTPDPLDLELWAGVRHHVGAGFSPRTTSVLNH